MRLGIDLDGVCYDFVDSTRYYFTHHRGFDPEVCKDAPTWDYYKGWGIPDYMEFAAMCGHGVDEGIIFRYGEPLPGTVDALKTLQAAGHTIHLITARAYGTKFYHNTADWITEHGIPHDSLTFAVKKNLGMVDVLLDDYPPHAIEAASAGVLPILFGQVYNTTEHYPEYNGLRVEGWQEFVDMIAKLERESSTQDPADLFDIADRLYPPAVLAQLGTS